MHKGLMTPPQNWWEGNAFRTPPFAPRQRRRPLPFGRSNLLAGINPLATQATATAAPWLEPTPDSGTGSYGDAGFAAGDMPAAYSPGADERFGEMPISGRGRLALGLAGMAAPFPLGLLATGTGLLGGAANIAANNRAREALGLDPLDIGQAVGGLLGLNEYGRGLDAVGESAAGVSAIGGRPGFMTPGAVAEAGIPPYSPEATQALGVANVPGGAAFAPAPDAFQTLLAELTAPEIESTPYEYDYGIGADIAPWEPATGLNFDYAYRHGGGVPTDRDRKLEPVPAVLHEGEFVMRPEAVRKYGRGLLDALNEGRVSAARLKGLMG